MPAIEMGQVMQTRVHTSRIRSLVDGKVTTAKNAQKPATRKPVIAHIPIRYFMTATPEQARFYAFPGDKRVTVQNSPLHSQCSPAPISCDMAILCQWP